MIKKSRNTYHFIRIDEKGKVYSHPFCNKKN